MRPIEHWARVTFYSAMLEEIAESALSAGKEDTVRKLDDNLAAAFPIKEELPRWQQRERQEARITNKQRKRAKNQGRCIQEILEGKKSGNLPKKEIMEPYWTDILTQPSESGIRPKSDRTVVDELFFPAKSSSAGPHRISPRL